MATTTLGFPYPASTDPPAGHTQIQSLATAVDGMPGIGSYTQTQINAFTAGEKRAGRIVWNSTTTTLQRCDGSAWADIVLGPAVSAPILVSPEERCNVSATAATGIVNVDTATSTVWLYTSNAAANWTFNFRGNSGTTLTSRLTVGDAISVVFLVTQGSTAYYPTSFTIDGTVVTPKWSGGSAPAAGNANSIDVYSFTIIKTASTPTYTVLAGAGRFA
jgi:hypothetical protein